MALKKSDLSSSLWAISCDELCGGTDACRVRDKVLFMLFSKYISDEDAKSKDFAPSVVIPKRASFTDAVALKDKRGIGDKINTQMLQPLIEASARLARSDFPDFDDPNELEEWMATVDRLTNLVSIFEKQEPDFSQNCAEHDDIRCDAYEYWVRRVDPESVKRTCRAIGRWNSRVSAPRASKLADGRRVRMPQRNDWPLAGPSVRTAFEGSVCTFSENREKAGDDTRPPCSDCTMANAFCDNVERGTDSGSYTLCDGEYNADREVGGAQGMLTAVAALSRRMSALAPVHTMSAGTCAVRNAGIRLKWESDSSDHVVGSSASLSLTHAIPAERFTFREAWKAYGMRCKASIGERSRDSTTRYALFHGLQLGQQRSVFSRSREKLVRSVVNLTPPIDGYAQTDSWRN